MKCAALRFLSRRYLNPNTLAVRWKHDKVSPNKPDLQSGPGLQDFISASASSIGHVHQVQHPRDIPPYLSRESLLGQRRKVFFEVYGCQMNTNDTEIVWSILKGHEYQRTGSIKDADVVLLMTCAIRDGAESTVWNRLKHVRLMKERRESEGRALQVGVLGCMAERLKRQLVEKEGSVDVVAGPDSYKDLPRLLAVGQKGQKAINVLLSLDETYGDVMPVKLDRKSRTAYVSIMRGCDNMCSYCIVPFTRGKERSRPVASIREEALHLDAKGIKEITLLGQNVNSYRDLSTKSDGEKQASVLAPGFKTVYKTKDFPREVLETIARYPNICKNLHLPAQSGSSTVLERMRRGYSREAYLNLVDEVRTIVPNVTLSSDFICGFCGESDVEFAETLSLIEQVGYHTAFLFAYSMREKTTAHRRFTDDVPDSVKQQRLRDMIKVFRAGAERLNAQFVGNEELILVEGASKRSPNDLAGRNDGNVKVIIPGGDIPVGREDAGERKTIVSGDFVAVRIVESNSQILKAVPLYLSGIREFAARNEARKLAESVSC
ncbi:hypothetical protein quinque_007408 [Culex quinquefasciatus]